MFTDNRVKNAKATHCKDFFRRKVLAVVHVHLCCMLHRNCKLLQFFFSFVFSAFVPKSVHDGQLSYYYEEYIV